MGCDIHCFAEMRDIETNQWEKVGDAFTLDDYDKKRLGKDKGNRPFDWRSYSMFAFLADVRNYDHCEPLSQPKGIPDNVCKEIGEEYEEWGCDAHSASYFTAKELLDFNYDKTFWNRRITKQTAPNVYNGASLAEEGEGINLTYRENLGEMFFIHLEELKSLGEPEDVRIVFWFDN